MALFAGALLRTIEFVMVTTDASFLGPGERAAAAAGSWAAEQTMRAEARALAAGEPAHRDQEPTGRFAPPAFGGRGRWPWPSWTEALADTHTHTVLPLDHSEELGRGWGQGFINSLLACWAGQSSRVSLQILLPSASRPGRG